ncbi:RimJ/RimL family protein N-acetyltransferase [Tamaricihabitans halophyticus]|uniref:RimJ/RimL family protein N-acetyltransferase n=1 Tax=Tamaricihabitans halophyticus TaxID=1262583 RepID=A0A4R2R6K9_9PSEU|nr:RimJ/RimL family protein N-acetyltransferase [Tamaricihabitans halophyticus]
MAVLTMTPNQVFLETDRLTLRRFTGADVTNLVELDSDPAVMRYLTGGTPTPPSMIQYVTLPKILRDYTRGPLGRWAAHERSTGEFVGWFALQPSGEDEADGLELSYRLRAISWGQGYATEVSAALLHKAFAELGVWRVFAYTSELNLASRRVLEKVGLRYLRTFQPRPDRSPAGHGEVEYELTREHWLAGSASELDRGARHRRAQGRHRRRAGRHRARRGARRQAG